MATDVGQQLTGDGVSQGLGGALGSLERVRARVCVRVLRAFPARRASLRLPFSLFASSVPNELP